MAVPILGDDFGEDVMRGDEGLLRDQGTRYANEMTVVEKSIK